MNSYSLYCYVYTNFHSRKVRSGLVYLSDRIKRLMQDSSIYFVIQ